MIEAAVCYFKQEAGFSRLLPLLAKKYCSLGRLGGSVTLAKLSSEEAAAFTSLFRKDYQIGQRTTISLEEFVQALAKTKFSGVNVLELLGRLCGYKLIGKATAAERQAELRKNFWQDLRLKHRQGLCPAWLDAVEAKRSGTRAVHLALEHNPRRLAANIELLLAALAQLPVPYIRLPVFSRKLCGDPHALDSSAPVGKLLLDALKVLALDEQGRSGRSAVEEDNERLYAFGLLRDDVLNFVTCSGLAGATDAAKTHEVGYLRQAWQEGAVLNVPLRELLSCPLLYGAKLNGGPVFIVENSGVFSSLVDLFVQKTGFLPPLLCTHGQFKLASWAAVERLAAAECSIWYSGDFDPEGLVIAQKLAERYPAQVHLWRYTLADYRRSLSPVKLDQLRLSKLTAVYQPSLLSVVKEMSQLQRAGYQEALVDQLVDDMVAGLCGDN
jgi:uncharacterized protein (TIGR02679 family)